MEPLKMKHLISLFVTLITLGGCTLSAQSTENTDSLRVLMIGNSYTFYNNMPSMLDTIASTQGKLLSITTVTKGGQTLAGHLQNDRLHHLLRQGAWDYVVIQEQSTNPAMPTDYVRREVYPAAHTIDSLVKVSSPQAKVVFYMTWGHKNGYRKAMPQYPLINTYQGMYHRLVTSYLEMTYDNNAICAPVGIAWNTVRTQRPKLTMYKKDDYHPTRRGSYLIANVLYMTMFPEPYHSDYTAGLPTETADYLQQVAISTVQDNAPILTIAQ